MTTDTSTKHSGLAVALTAWTIGWLSSALHGAVFMKGWEWFVTGSFGLTPLSFIQAWGLSALVSFATYQYQENVKEFPDDQVVRMSVAFVTSVIVSAGSFISLLILSTFL